ncbi:triose phosphate isomerase [Dictyostelium discoideum AX4]|uniref:Triosephosphate isomerase n=1 Tax=Dictyostelium discoideum TaxID=44689 RepID=TPIS_DICDI|nr:triose phosphate isomerase [Dictyostelium discoideum AX4]Q869R8.1 RecName: Full=Triosephosphate isomerase; Short=TIM; AltName: Full=Triose-phosphate isomerase [Dictyostelium discoideum]EAL70128.1 triose phosphate isomerase [Dictyostelium discoideum AX4]|eukprot:XP_644150.1 triose phosphate isomerase [Dictyostelium discoideum AX4]
MTGTRTFFVGGNHKMNGSKSMLESLSKGMNESVENKENVDIFIAPSYPYLEFLSNKLDNKKFKVCSQNCYSVAKGAFTGEISANMLVDLGIPYVIIGHSERRNVFSESSELITKKTKYAISLGLTVILCLGELLADRKSNNTEHILSEQLKDFASFTPEEWSKIVIAYEPVWAIGTGAVATPQEAQDTHVFIRKWISEKVSEDVAKKTSIMYGGSVNADNCHNLSKQSDIDGFLVGGASLVASDFIAIIKSAVPKKY